MKTFTQFIQEDFNSPKATQVTLPVMAFGRSKKGPSNDMLAFFEIMPKRSFNLLRYMKTFDSQNAKDILNNISGHWRGLIFSTAQELLVFVWKGTVIHHQIGQAIDKIAGKEKVPAHKYMKAYNTMNMLDSGESIDSNWCFPLVYMNGQLRTNLQPVALDELEKQKRIKELFQLDDTQFSSLLKDDM